MAKHNPILVPEGARIPEDLKITVVPPGDIVTRLSATTAERAIMPVTSRELQILVEYRDLLDVSLLAVIGLQGVMYNTIWNTYVSTMTRTTVDTLLAEQQAENDARALHGQNPGTTSESRRQSIGRPAAVTFAGDESDDTITGDIGG